MQKDIKIQVGGCSIFLFGQNNQISINSAGYQGSFTGDLTDDLKLALITFVSILLESEEK